MSRMNGATPPSVTPDAPRVYLVAAVAKNGVIGAKGAMPWHLPEDLKHFKKLTLGHPVIMGRRTWDSLPRALPGRENIVLTRSTDRDIQGASVAASLHGALALCVGEPTAFVIGGAEIYRIALPLCDGLVLTEIDRDYEGDTFFPPWDRGEFRESQRETHTSADGVRFDFVLYEKKPRAQETSG